MQNKSNSISTEQFLDYIHGPGANIYFNVSGKTWKTPSPYADIKGKLTWLNKSKKSDIYYIVNSGGRKNNDIVKINSCYIDWDCGRDTDDNYFPLDIVIQKKQTFLSQIGSFPLSPSFIVETRNGYHCYWTLNSGTSIEAFHKIEEMLIDYFNADTAVSKLAQVMRLPGYDWYKNTDQSFGVKIISANNNRYDSDKMIQTLFSLEKSDSNLTCKESRKSAPINTTSLYYNSEAIIEGTFSQATPSDKHIFQGMNEVIDYIKKQNLAEYLEVNIDINKDSQLNICCPFHSDIVPSASVYKYSDGYYYLKCHSKECNVGPMTIIDIVMKKEKLNTSEAIQNLMRFYNIQIDDTSWRSKQNEINQHNIDIINNIANYKDEYPYLYKMISRIKDDLLSKLEFAQDHIALRSTLGELMLVCSLRDFEKIRTNGVCYDGDSGRQNERIDRYCLLGLMRKLPDDEIPVSVLRNAHEQRRAIQKGLGKKVNLPRTQIYTIPEYTSELLQEANETAQLIKENRIRMNAISRDCILTIFGEEKAKTIYPQNHRKGISKSGKQMIPKIEETLLREISLEGYATTGKIIEELQKKYDWKSITDKRVKKYLPALLQKHNFIEMRASKNIKNEYSIDCPGYPAVIIPQSNMDIDDNPVKIEEDCQPIKIAV